MNIVFQALISSWRILEAASLYLLFGFVIAGIIRVYISADSIVNYLQRGRFKSVFYASLLGIPIPLCSCGVVPAVAGFKRQGANNGACLSFLTSTPETGIDSIALTYSLLGPILTLMRPITAFFSAMSAGLIENFTGKSYIESGDIVVDRTCIVDACCDGIGCDPWVHTRHHTFLERLRAGMRFAFDDLMEDLAVWFVIGIVIAGIITVIIPDSFVKGAMGSGISSYLIAIVISGPMYVCATLSTPVAAALVMKGMSPGAALVMLMAGPATNVTTISMVLGLLGKRSLGIYIGSIVVCSLFMAFITDLIYRVLGISAGASAGFTSTGGAFWEWSEWAAALILGGLILRSLWKNHLRPYVGSLLGKNISDIDHGHKCSCSEGCCRSSVQEPTADKSRE
ncbi:MAG: SO_0444 family Cu/Zn efflux transporter [Desulfomonilaceae bacterium]